MSLRKSSLCRLIILFCLQLPALAAIAGKATQSAATEPCSATTQSELCSLIAAGQLNDLHWPRFSDYQTELQEFYLPSNYALAWVRNNQPTPQARAVIHALQDADRKGLQATDYDGPLWDTRIASLVPPAPKPSSSELARFDLAVTVSVMRYISALHNGRINPRHFAFGVNIEHQKYNLAQFLSERLLPAQDAQSTLEQVEPSYGGYLRARTALERYVALAREGEGDPLPAFKKLIKPGDDYPGEQQLAQRLRRLGDLPPEAIDSLHPGVYDSALVEAVKHFQQRHGLPANGSIDRATFNQIVMPLSHRIEQLQLTLERWRWLPPDLPERFIVVNVPEFALRAHENHHSSLSMRVVVGKAFHGHQTPVFQEQMEYLIFRPYWNVPPSITRRELIPEMKKHPDYLEKHDFQVVNHRGEVVTADLESAELLAQLRSGVLEIRQKPGPGNSLGLIKFIFPNNYNVYLHGTPEQALFSRSRRAFSHGCIRVEDPAMLAAWILHDDPSWTSDRIQQAMNAADSVRVNLPRPIPVLVLYATARVEENGEVHFFEDIYGQDSRLERALATGYPYPRQRNMSN